MSLGDPRNIVIVDKNSRCSEAIWNSRCCHFGSPFGRKFCDTLSNYPDAFCRKTVLIFGKCFVEKIILHRVSLSFALQISNFLQRWIFQNISQANNGFMGWKMSVLKSCWRKYDSKICWRDAFECISLTLKVVWISSLFYVSLKSKGFGNLSFAQTEWHRQLIRFWSFFLLPAQCQRHLMTRHKYFGIHLR